TYYGEKGPPVLQLAMQYVFWNTGVPPLTRRAALAQSKGRPKRGVAATAIVYMWSLFEHGSAFHSEPGGLAMIADVTASVGIRAASLAMTMLVPERRYRRTGRDSSRLPGGKLSTSATRAASTRRRSGRFSMPSASRAPRRASRDRTRRLPLFTSSGDFSTARTCGQSSS